MNLAKSIFTGVFIGIFSAMTLMFITRKVGPTGISGMDDLLIYAPSLIGSALGYYVGKFAYHLAANEQVQTEDCK